MVAGLLLIVGSGAVAILARGSFVVPLASVALLLGFSSVVMSAFYSRVHGVVRWLGLKIWIDGPTKKR
jgi:hypothetical protein